MPEVSGQTGSRFAAISIPLQYHVCYARQTVQNSVVGSLICVGVAAVTTQPVMGQILNCTVQSKGTAVYVSMLPVSQSDMIQHVEKTVNVSCTFRAFHDY